MIPASGENVGDPSPAAICVRDVMYQAFDLLDDKLLIRDAFSALQYPNNLALIIHRSDADAAYGVVLIDDLNQWVQTDGLGAEHARLRDIMTASCLGVPPDTPIRQCVRMMQKSAVRAAYVIEDQQLLGLVNFRDLVARYLASVIGSAWSFDPPQPGHR